jgi:hypothetical protein
MVLETTVPYTVVITRMPEALHSPPQRLTLRGAEDARRKLEGIQLAMLLATDRPSGS